MVGQLCEKGSGDAYKRNFFQKQLTHLMPKFVFYLLRVCEFYLQI